jgi:spore coat polysaccharide biosynthesis protein SpsF
MPWPKVVTVIQARIGSTRLPGKVLRPLTHNTSLLLHLVERVRAAQLVGSVVVATTTLPEDKMIVELCQDAQILCMTGHPTDLLERHVQVGLAFAADVLVKIPSDCPLIDPAVIDRVIGAYLAEPDRYDYVSNLHPATYPDGNDVEVMRMVSLGIAWKKAQRSFEREHTTPYFWEQPELFRLHNVTWETGLDYSMSHRWTIDYEEDYRFIRAVYEALYRGNPLFGLADILDLLEQHPSLAEINGRLAGVNWYRHYVNELNTIDWKQTRPEPDEMMVRYQRPGLATNPRRDNMGSRPPR